MKVLQVWVNLASPQVGAAVDALREKGYFLGGVSSNSLFLLVGVFLGLGWGVVMPLLSAIVFDISQPRFRALNTNLAMVMFQTGFFLGPLLGGAFLLHWGHEVMYVASGITLALTTGLMLLIKFICARLDDEWSLFN